MNQDESRWIKATSRSRPKLALVPLPCTLCVCAIHPETSTHGQDTVSLLSTMHKKRCQGSNNVKPVHSIPRAGQLLIQSQRQCHTFGLYPDSWERSRIHPPDIPSIFFVEDMHIWSLTTTLWVAFGKNGRTSTNLELVGSKTPGNKGHLLRVVGVLLPICPLWKQEKRGNRAISSSFTCKTCKGAGLFVIISFLGCGVVDGAPGWRPLQVHCKSEAGQGYTASTSVQCPTHLYNLYIQFVDALPHLVAYKT